MILHSQVGEDLVGETRSSTSTLDQLQTADAYHAAYRPTKTIARRHP